MPLFLQVVDELKKKISQYSISLDKYSISVDSFNI